MNGFGYNELVVSIRGSKIMRYKRNKRYKVIWTEDRNRMKKIKGKQIIIGGESVKSKALNQSSDKKRFLDRDRDIHVFPDKIFLRPVQLFTVMYPSVTYLRYSFWTTCLHLRTIIRTVRIEGVKFLFSNNNQVQKRLSINIFLYFPTTPKLCI